MNTDMLNGYPVIASANLSARRGCFPARIVIVDRSEPSGSMGKDPFVVALHRDGDSHWVDGAYYETWIEAWEDFKDRVQSDRPRSQARDSEVGPGGKPHPRSRASKPKAKETTRDDGPEALKKLLKF